VKENSKIKHIGDCSPPLWGGAGGEVIKDLFIKKKHCSIKLKTD
jgi:hypothetical protein